MSLIVDEPVLCTKNESPRQFVDFQQDLITLFFKEGGNNYPWWLLPMFSGYILIEGISKIFIHLDFGVFSYFPDSRESSQFLILITICGLRLASLAGEGPAAAAECLDIYFYSVLEFAPTGRSRSVTHFNFHLLCRMAFLDSFWLYRIWMFWSPSIPSQCPVGGWLKTTTPF